MLSLVKCSFASMEKINALTHVKELLTSDRASHIFKHLQNSELCHAACSADFLHVLDHTSTSFQLKMSKQL